MPDTSTRPQTAAATADAGESVPLLTIDGSRATIRLNRPQHLNRLHPEDVAELSRHFAQIEQDRSIRVVVLTGTGRVFGAGYHLGELAEQRKNTDTTAVNDGPYQDTAFERMCIVPKLVGYIPVIIPLRLGAHTGACV